MAVTKVVMPKLSEAMESGKIIKWLKKEGDRIQGGDILAEVETDKADVEMEAFGAGVLRKILVPAGDTAPVGTLIGVIAEPGDDLSALVASAPHGAGAGSAASQRPAPEAFDLTKERLAEFEPAHTWFSIRIFGVVFVVVFLLAVWEFFFRGGPKGPFTLDLLLGLLFMGFLALFLSFAAALMVCAPVGMIVEALWKRMQSDYPRLRAYERAVARYQIEHAAWLKTQRSWWDRLHPRRFEEEVAEFFKKHGHRVVWTGRSGDGGVDIRLTTQDGKKVIVQCKAHGKPVSPGAVRDLYGTLLHEKSDEAWLMSRSGFTDGASKFAAGKAIRLFNLDHVLPGLGSIVDSPPAPRRRS